MDKASTIKALKGTSTDPVQDKGSMIKALNTTEEPEPALMLSDEKDPADKSKSWGFHLLINCSGLNEKMDSEDAIETFFTKLIKQMKMTPLTDFFCTKVEGEEGRGISAFQMITTSHISMHFDDDKRCGYLDIFSCKDFDADAVVKEIKSYFQPKHIASQLIYRDAGLGKDDSDDDTD